MRTCRTEAERRIVALAGDLAGWTADPVTAADDESLWLVTPPVHGGVQLGRVVVVGIAPEDENGGIEPTAIAKTSEAEDQWQIEGAIFLSGASSIFGSSGDSDDPAQAPWIAKQAVEDALNDLRDVIAGNQRLQRDDWPFIGAVATLSAWVGPWFSQSDDGEPLGTARFTITCTAQLRSGT